MQYKQYFYIVCYCLYGNQTAVNCIAIYLIGSILIIFIYYEHLLEQALNRILWTFIISRLQCIFLTDIYKGSLWQVTLGDHHERGEYHNCLGRIWSCHGIEYQKGCLLGCCKINNSLLSLIPSLRPRYIFSVLLSHMRTKMWFSFEPTATLFKWNITYWYTCSYLTWI